MLRFELETAAFLTASSGVSLIVLWLSRPKERKIQLPLHEGEDGDVQEDGEGTGSHSSTGTAAEEAFDPFDVTRPQDLFDGEPIDEQGFWRRTKRWKKLLAFCLALTLIFESASLGWNATRTRAEDKSTHVIVAAALRVTFALYVLVIGFVAVKQETLYAHARSIIHIAALTCLAFVSRTIISIIPSTPPPVAVSTVSPVDKIPFWSWYAALGTYFLSCMIAATIPLGPPLHYPPEWIYSQKVLEKITSRYENNVSGEVGGSIWSFLLFSYTNKVIMLGYTSESLEIGDLPILPKNMRATWTFSVMRNATRTIRLKIFNWRPKPGSGLELAYQILRVNSTLFAVEVGLSVVLSGLFYAPYFFLERLIRYLELDPERKNRGWGFVYCAGMLFINCLVHLATPQLFIIFMRTLQSRLRTQINTTLFAKTLMRKDVVSSSGAAGKGGDSPNAATEKEDKDEFSTKAQIMNLMTTDVDRIAEAGFRVFALINSPLEMVVATFFLYKLLGVSCFIGLLVIIIFIPINHYTGKANIGTQEKLMKARDERVALINEILGAIRMVKFMAWERSFEKRVMEIRERELKYQKNIYNIETLLRVIWNGSPLLVILVTFWHYSVVRQQPLTASVAFTSISIFAEMKFALNILPETLIAILQILVSLRRVEKYLHGAEVKPVPPLNEESCGPIVLRSANITWAQDRSGNDRSAVSSTASTPRSKFTLFDLSLKFPFGGLSLICGKLGSGKSLLLLALLGEADVLSGQVICPRSPPNALASFEGIVPSEDEWVVNGICGYVPQSAWLRNASIRDNILFDLPYVEERYRRTLEACALPSDLAILEDGDQSEIGERGINLSGGQKARVSLARAVYSRASVLLMDDVLSAVDAHTARHLFDECLQGDLMRGRTVILVSHHVQLCAPGANYIVSLDNGKIQFQGDYDTFRQSGLIADLSRSGATDPSDTKEDNAVVTVEERLVDDASHPVSSTEASSDTGETAVEGDVSLTKPEEKKAPRKFVEEEKRAVGRIRKDVWSTYFTAFGSSWYWIPVVIILIAAALSPVLENGWLKIWTGASSGDSHKSAMYYVVVYAIITGAGVFTTTFRWFILYSGAIHASSVLYKRLLGSVLFAKIRYHDTISRGPLLNRFGKDFEGVDSRLPQALGWTIIFSLNVAVTVVTLTAVGGLPIFLCVLIVGTLYYQVAKIYGQTSRDMRRLTSVTRSPLYSIYGETIAGVTVLRAFGASSKMMKDMLRYVDTNANPFYWMMSTNRWLGTRFVLLGVAVVNSLAVLSVLSPRLDAPLVGFVMIFANSAMYEMMMLVQRWVALEQAMVDLERIKEFSELPREPPEIVEPRPPATWPTTGSIKCENLVIRYAPGLPNVLHGLNFEIKPSEKIGVLGRTGSGKSTLALSFFRFVDATEGRILIDDIDIAQIGLADLRSRITIIPQDPTILSGTLRSNLDVFNEYEDAKIFEALRRVHLIPATDEAEDPEMSNINVFRDLDSQVSEGGENFSAGEKQLLCMARAILKRSKVLVMDEATASVDYATDELIGRTIRDEFADSTIVTIAHRLRTIIDYDRVMLLEEGRLVEFDKPSHLLKDPRSKFYSLCKATGKQEFSVLRKMAGV